MKTYRVVKTYKYTEVVFVEANSKKEAEEMAANQEDEGERQNDDSLYSCEAKDLKS